MKTYDKEKFYIGRLCPQQHFYDDSGGSLRYLKGKKCTKCRKKYRKNNREKIKEYLKNNREKLKEYHKKYRKNNREKIKEYHKKYRKNNREKLKECKKEHYKNNREKIKEHHKEYSKNNREKIKEYLKKYCKNNREKLTDGYIKNQLQNQTGLKASEISEDLIKLKRAQISLIREIKQITKTRRKLDGNTRSRNQRT